MRQTLQRHTDKRTSDQGADADAKYRQGQAGRDLVGHQGQGQEGKYQSQGSTGGGARQNAQGGAVGGQGDGEGADRAQQHHALDAKVQNAGFLHHQFASGGEQQRRGGADYRYQDGGQGLHQPASDTSVVRPQRTRYRTSTSAASRKNSNMP